MLQVAPYVWPSWASGEVDSRLYHTLLRLIPGWGSGRLEKLHSLHTAQCIPAMLRNLARALHKYKYKHINYDYKYMTCTLATNAFLSCSLRFPMPSSTTYLCTSPSNLQPPVHRVHIVHMVHTHHVSWQVGMRDHRCNWPDALPAGLALKPYPMCIHWGVVHFEWAFKQNLRQAFFLQIWPNWVEIILSQVWILFGWPLL